MNEENELGWTDTCRFCGATEPTPSMLWVNEENENDDRLICDECYEPLKKLINRIELRRANNERER